MPSSGSGSASGVITPPVVNPPEYPDGGDLEDFLRATGLLPSILTESQQAMDFDGAMQAASAELEERTKAIPFLSNGEEETRTFRVAERNPFFLPNGVLLAEISDDADAITIDGETYTVGTDVLLLPEDAPLRNRPYTRLWIAKGRAETTNIDLLPYRTPGFNANAATLSIKGQWGFCTELRENVKQALLSYGALQLAPQLALQISGGLYSVGRMTFSIRYSGAGNSPLSAEMKLWETTFNTCVKNIKQSILR